MSQKRRDKIKELQKLIEYWEDEIVHTQNDMDNITDVNSLVTPKEQERLYKEHIERCELTLTYLRALKNYKMKFLGDK